MTDDRAAPDSASGGEPLSSSMDIRNEHAQLRRGVLRDLQDSDKAAPAAESIRAFIRRAQTSGTFISDESERKAAQAIIDYWTAELASSSEAKESDYAPTLLAPFAAPQTLDDKGPKTPNDDEKATASGSEEQRQSREIIRLAATARLWRDSGEERGYLLLGSAIEQAARYRDVDPDIGRLVDKSEEAVRETAREVAWQRKVWWLWLGLAASALFLVSLPIIHYRIAPWLARSELKVLSDVTTPKAKQASLWRLDFYERFMPASEISSLYLTSVRGLGGTNLREIQLYGAGFVQSSFPYVDFTRATLPSSSFTDSTIVGSRFNEANLSYSQFRGAQIRLASFTGAKLYRAVFDGAQLLYDVNFSQADLRGASFRYARMGESFTRTFENTAWWLAVGWSSQDLGRLMDLKQDESILKESTAFKDDLRNAQEAVLGTNAGTLQRASALNSLAWRLATWGVDIESSNRGSVEDEGDCTKNSDVPDNALNAASEAVCIAGKLKEQATDQAVVAAMGQRLANFQDTLAYVLLQTKKTPDALPKAVEVLQESMNVSKSKAVMFRYSIALYASQKKDEAIGFLRTSMGDENYTPSHELQNLRKYLRNADSTNTDFLDRVYAYIDDREP